MKRITNKQGGFTLIEVVLVLAIGALIILLALLAFSGAQRARRDTARTNLVGTMISNVEQYAANNNGSYPDGTAFNALVSTNSWKDPKGGTAAIVVGSTALPSPGIRYQLGTNCAGASTGYKIEYIQEGSSTTVCKDSN